LHHTLFRCGQ